jgi:hypothetical protein
MIIYQPHQFVPVLNLSKEVGQDLPVGFLKRVIREYEKEVFHDAVKLPFLVEKVGGMKKDMGVACCMLHVACC